MLIVNSIPKSGTYLVSLFLREIGLSDSYHHLRNNCYWNFKTAPMQSVIADPDQYKINITLDKSLRLLNDNDFAVAHLNHSESTKETLKLFNILQFFLVRNIRDTLVSHMRFLEDFRRISRPASWVKEHNKQKKFFGYLNTIGTSYINGILKQIKWVNENNVLIVKYEMLVGDYGESQQVSIIHKMLTALNNSNSYQSPTVKSATHALSILKNNVLGKPTRTYSGSRSYSDDFWSEDSEMFFREHHGYNLNQTLGY